MANQVVSQPARRQFALSGLALGAAALTARGALAQQQPTAAPGRPAQASGPIVLHGASPRLTVHALDTFHGAAATGLRIDFSRLEGGSYKPLRGVVMNGNGRSDDPLLVGDSYQPGHFELRFHVGEHFKASDGLSDVVPVRFSIFDAAQHYHVPMLCAPWFFSTYRGS